MNKLIRELIEPFLTEEERPKIKKVIGIYGGRFQPFGPHHLKTFKWLEKQFDTAYITTSNIKRPPKHPMNFREKVRHMVKMGVPSSKIIMEKIPFVAKSLLSKFDSKTTAVVYIFGAKDAGRLSGGKYFQDYKKNKNDLKGHEEHGYVLVAPHVSITAGGLEVSGTSMRELLGSSKYDDDERQRLFKKMFGYYDKGIFQMMTNKFKKLFDEGVNEDVNVPINIGDTVKMGKFKNKKVVVKTITWNEKGDMLINGKPALKFRLVQQPNIFDSELKESSGLPGYSADAGESDTGYTAPGKTRTIGKDAQPDVWFNRGGYEQLHFPKADNPFGKDTQVMSAKKSVVNPDIYQEPIESDDYITVGVGTKGKDFVKALTEDMIFERLMPTHITEELVGKEKIEECITIAKMFSGDMVLGKNRDRNYKPRLKIVRERTSYGVEVCYVVDVDTDWTEGLNEYGVGIVNTALFVKRDEKDYDKAKKKMAPSKDGVRVREALGKGNLKDAVRSLVSYHGGIKGHTTAGNGKKIVTIENTSRVKPVIKVKDLNKEPIVRTNHGLEHTEAGYQDGQDKLSSELRMINALNVTHQTNDWENLFPNMYKHTQDKGPKFDLVRAQNKLWTSSQMAINLNKKELILYLIPNQVKYIGVENNLPEGYDPKIKIKVVTYPKKEYDEVFTKTWWKRLLMEGGAYGHMAHPFDDKSLTFSDLKTIIELGLGGQLNREDNVTEKLDGQNLMISWRDGKLIAARNKGHLKNGGKTALDAKGIGSKFAGRGNIANAFSFAMKDLGKAIGSLSEKQRIKIFNNGHNFMNLEIMWPASANVIDYDVATIVFHGALKYDDSGNARGEVPGSGRMLAGMIKQVNQHIQKKYSIGKPQFLTVPKHQDFGKMKSKYLGRVDKLRNQYGLKDGDTLALYHQSYWEEYIYNAAKQFGYTIPNKVLVGLTKRWAFFDKSYKIPQVKKDIKDEKFLEWVLAIDKNDHSLMVKNNMKPFEILFFEVGAEIMKNMSGFISANPNKSVQGIKKKLDAATSSVRSGGDLKKLNTLKAQIDKLNAIGGTEAIVPSEGIVFKYNGTTYKFTGAFAPINQITGLMSF